jgi:FdhD protein
MPEKYTTPYPAEESISDAGLKIPKFACKRMPVKLFLDGKPFTTLFASPLEQKELAVGHLITEGIISFREIAGVEVEGSEVHVLTQKKKSPILTEFSQKTVEAGKQIFVNSDAVFDPEALFAGYRLLDPIHTNCTRGTHLAALIDKKGKLAVQIVDVGMHNAVDKVVGAAFLRGREPLANVTCSPQADSPLTWSQKQLVQESHL